jgi:hypothetical protein
LIEQRRGFVIHHGDGHRLMYALACRLAALGIAWNDDVVLEGLHQDFILMPFHIDIADAVFCDEPGLVQRAGISIPA